MSPKTQTYNLGFIAERIGAQLVGDAALCVAGIGDLQSAAADQLSFLSDPKYRRFLTETEAAAVILAPDQAEHCPSNCLLMENPYLGYARASQLFDDFVRQAPQVHASAEVAEDVSLGEGVYVGPNAVLESGVALGAGCYIGAGVFIGRNTQLGARCLLHPNVVIYHNCSLGDECIIQSGAVIGSDGFGYARSAEGWEKIAQLGAVRLGNRVAVGANTCIDRGALQDTQIADGVILDNLIQVAHNVEVGENTAMAGCVGIAGSVKIGKNCMLAGGAGLSGHIEVADNVQVTGMSIITKSISEPGAYSSGTGTFPHSDWKKMVVRLRQLDTMAKRVKQLEQLLESLQTNNNKS